MRKDWLDKEGFIQLTSLRQFPSQVLRKLAVVLKTECLPLHEESVQVILRQATFHIGTLRFRGDHLDFMWRLDFEEIRTNCLVLIADVAEKYAETPSFSTAFVILAELACYFSSTFVPKDTQNAVSNKDVGIKLAIAAMQWGLSCDDEVLNSTQENVSLIRSRQVNYFRTAALCLVHEKDLSLQEATILLKCIVRAKNTFNQDVDDLEEQDDLNVRYIYFLSNNSSYQSLLVRYSETFSEVLKCVVITAPDSLNWIQDDASDYCFSANGSDGHVYAMNTLTGVVLIDGLPPNSLPSSITNDKRYKRVFGNNNFEVVLKGEILETARPSQGCLYRFRKSSDSLLIEESAQIDHESDIVGCWEDPLELLDIMHIATWGNELPKKLKDSYSHWVSRKRNVVLFRRKEYHSRNCIYLHTMTACERCDVFERGKMSESIGLETLVIHDSPILSILERIEAREMIHSFLLPSDSYKKHTVVFELYRFGLKFALEPDSGVLKCLEIVGYQLAPIQHLEGQLTGLCNYLVLENSSDVILKKIIFPFGEIIRSKNSSVVISLSTKDLSPTRNNVNEEMQLFQYAIHPRFKTLEASSISARLFLAALFAATMSNLPDSALGMTGEEQACVIVRQCQVNRPFSPIEMKSLDNLLTLSRGKSSILCLLCYDLQRNAVETYFLHNTSDSVSTKVEKFDKGRFNDDASAYLTTGDTVSSRMLLTSGESSRIIGNVKLQSHLKTSRRDVILLEIDKCPILREDIDSFHTRVSTLWLEDSCQVLEDQKGFPIRLSANTDLEKVVYGELKKSWKLHCEERGININPVENTIASIQKIGWSVALTLSTTKKYIFDALTHQHPIMNHWHARALDYLRLINVIPTATEREIVALACDFPKVTEYNPLLSKTSVKRIRQAVIMWLELCVLQDKLSFLLSLGSSKDKDFMKELTSHRS